MTQAKFIPDYFEARIFEQDPFQTIDQKGVGELVKIAVERGRKGNKDLPLRYLWRTWWRPCVS